MGTEKNLEITRKKEISDDVCQYVIHSNKSDERIIDKIQCGGRVE